MRLAWSVTRSRLAGALLGVAAGLTACNHDEDKHHFDRVNGQVSHDVSTLLALAGGFETLLGHLQATNLDDLLAGDAPHTVFAPNDGAFAGWPADRVDSLGSAGVANVLRYHTAAGRWAFAGGESRFEGLGVEGIEPGDPVNTLLPGESVVLDETHEGLVLGGIVRVQGHDALATNGMVHAVDGVLLPNNLFPGTIAEAIAAYPMFTPLTAAVEAAGLTETLDGAGPFTLFAPSESAWSAIAVADEEGELVFSSPVDPADELTAARIAELVDYLVAEDALDASEVRAASTITTRGGDITVTVDDGAVLLDDADPELDPGRATWFDLQCTNGIIHVIDTVLRPADLEEAPQ